MALAWADPAFDRLQLEDYDFVIAGDGGRHERARAYVADLLGYVPAQTDYFAGFVASSTAPSLWRAIARAIAAARHDGFGEVYVWASSQVLRDGFIHHRDDEEEAMAFHDVLYPMDVAFGAQIGPRFSTVVTTTASGFEQRNSNWAQARLEVDGGTGLRSDADLQLLLAFFQARRGRAFAFRFRDPMDHASGSPVSPQDQALLMAEVVACGPAVRAMGLARGFGVEKLNLGALGNVTPQLHLHLVGRRPGDPAWPGPVWGVGVADPLSPDQAADAMSVARAALKI